MAYNDPVRVEAAYGQPVATCISLTWHSTGGTKGLDLLLSLAAAGRSQSGSRGRASEYLQLLSGKMFSSRTWAVVLNSERSSDSLECTQVVF